jgi:nicotinate-nucleotide pyrophosphorylase (carboxylating)
VDEVVAVLDSGAAPHVTRVMLDNMARRDPAAVGGVDVALLQHAVARLGGRVKTEASGNVTLESVAAIAATGVTYISCGSLTHSVKALDISLNIETQ